MDTHTTTKPEIALPSGYTSRAATIDDLPAVYALYAAIDMAEVGRIDIALAEIQAGWEEPSVNLAEDVWLVFDAAGHLVAEADVFRQGPARVWGYAAVHPDHQGRGLGAHLLGHIERRAHDWATHVPLGERVELRQSVSAGNVRARALLEDVGYVAIRRFRRMQIEFAQAPELPRWPEGICVRALLPGVDEHAVYEAMQEAFADHWGHVPLPFEEYAHWHFAGETFDPSLHFLAMDGETVAGAALCQLRPDMGFIQTLGVRRPYRRTGLGTALLRHAFAQTYTRGKRTVGLEVDAESLTGAVRLYERAGMRTMREWIHYEKALCGGMRDDVDDTTHYQGHHRR